MSIALVILAAGKGTRMRSDLPKVLHKVAGAPLLAHAMASGASLSPERTVIVTGHGAEQVKAAAREIDETATCVLQSEQLGTGHAVLQARPALEGFSGDVIVLYGDTPFIRPETLEAMAEARRSHDVVVLGFTAADPGKYGRLVMEGDALMQIVEFKDAGLRERAIDFCNSGVISASADTFFALLDRVGNDNASGEYYLTDIVALAREAGLSATAVSCDEAETMGVNSRVDLAAAEAGFQSRKRAEALIEGVTMTAPETVWFAHDTWIGPDCEIEPNVVFGPGVTIENGAHIRAFSHLEGCHVSRGAVVGPYARLRPGAELAEDVRVGNFVEMKKAVLGEGAKANHLTYLGDAEVGAGANIGAGTITCNYDGYFKYKTVIGERAFIGSNSSLIAPVTIGADAIVGAGSAVSRDVGAGDLRVVRGEQSVKPGWADRFHDAMKKKKAAEKKD
mgnify:CR=1 FL=1